MAITHLKRGKPDTLRDEENTQVRSVVEGILSDIEMRGEAAIRELSAKFDKYMPVSFRLSHGDIDALMNRVSPVIWQTSSLRRRRSATSHRLSAIP
jgi:sulfopropanediol 3-dehydrogenase